MGPALVAVSIPGTKAPQYTQFSSQLGRVWNQKTAANAVEPVVTNDFGKSSSFSRWNENSVCEERVCYDEACLRH